jgi:hypothetical protein
MLLVHCLSAPHASLTPMSVSGALACGHRSIQAHGSSSGLDSKHPYCGGELIHGCGDHDAVHPLIALGLIDDGDHIVAIISAAVS